MNSTSTPRNNSSLRNITRLLVANRGEIAIRVLRAADELKIKTVALYTFEDRYSLHCYKADEAYQIGPDSEPLKPYLDIDEIISLAKRVKVDAIHPGYGFLSENVDFAKRCEENSIIWIGPRPETMQALGDKIAAKSLARKLNIPIIKDSQIELTSFEEAKSEADSIGYPVIIKASGGGGGRGMRVAKDAKELKRYFDEARNEAGRAFNNRTVFIESFIDNPKHIEVQILGDKFGNIVHLFERDCSVQRRFQKVVEIAPSRGLLPNVRAQLYEYSLKIAREVGYCNAGTVEFLVDPKQNIYFIEVNPRIQVEHTVTEEVTGIDIVRSQILIAKGHKLSDREIYIPSQETVKCNGYAVQCRITTEDPANDFKPDFGRIIAYRNAAGFGIRLDEGSSYAGVNVSPFFDSMLVKVTASGRTLWGAADRLKRALREFRIRGVKTNIEFLQNVVSHSEFQRGKATVNFLGLHPQLLDFATGRDRGTKALRYLAQVTVNGNPAVSKSDPGKHFRTAIIPEYDRYAEYPNGTKQKLNELGRSKFIEWIKTTNEVQFTDTTFRDAHQSILATRVRTVDLLNVAESFARSHPEIFSMEVWGGATFDVALRFLHECPWQRLTLLRDAMPNTLLQMLLRGSNAVGYSAYPDNLLEKFVEKSAETGIDIFRIFDSLNWLEAMKVSIQAVVQRTESLAEGCICYTGDILDKSRTKYSLQYYLDMARQLEDLGCHILGIKDMAGLLKPYAAKLLVSELKNVVSIPVHLHTHDTSGVQNATLLNAIDSGVDIVDVAIASMSGTTSQPNFNSLVASLIGHPRSNNCNLASLNLFSNYWEDVREYYYPFESELKCSTAEVYQHEIPGGQYSNLRPQARSLGLEDKFEQIKKNYIVVNRLFGDIIKVTPSSKAVGDLALFMTANNLTEQDIMREDANLAFPESTRQFFRGDLGQPHGGFPSKLQKIVLKGEKPITGRPNEHLAPIEFEQEFKQFQCEFSTECTFLDFLSYKMYPKVFKDYYEHIKSFGEVWAIPTQAFFYGLKPNQEILVPIGPGKTLLIRMLYVSETDENGKKTVFFKLNGQTRGVEVNDATFKSSKPTHKKATEPGHVGSPLQGRISKLLVNVGDSVRENDQLFVIEAMKMESSVSARSSGTVAQIVLSEGTLVEQDDLVVDLKLS